MSDRFLRLPVDKRLRDTTVGSVRLALGLLRPYVHKHISDDFTTATTHLCDLAYIISCWPGQWWVREHPETRDLLRCMVHIVGEEMREARKMQALDDTTRMQEIVGSLEQLAKAYETRNREHKHIPHPILTPRASFSSSSTLPSPLDDKSETWSTSSTAALITSESKGIQTDSLEAPNPSPSQPAIAQPVEPRVRPPPRRTRIDEKSRPYDFVARTASCFFTGLFIGSFITLCLWSSHRREVTIAHHFT